MAREDDVSFYDGNTIKPKLVLDLDETLVNAYIHTPGELESMPPIDSKTFSFEID
jgi:hypothetical protein